MQNVETAQPVQLTHWRHPTESRQYEEAAASAAGIAKTRQILVENSKEPGKRRDQIRRSSPLALQLFGYWQAVMPAKSPTP